MFTFSYVLSMSSGGTATTPSGSVAIVQTCLSTVVEVCSAERDAGKCRSSQSAGAAPPRAMDRHPEDWPDQVSH